MKKIALSIVFATVAATCSAQIAVYNCSTLMEGIQPGVELKSSDSGKMFYDFATTNSITVMVDTKAKRVQMISSMNQVATTITGKGEDTFTAIISVPTNALPAGSITYVGTPIFGKNGSLEISSSQTVTFPKILNRHMETVTYNPPDNSGYSRADEVYTFSQADTQTANANGQSIDDAAQAMVDALVAKGYESF